MESQQFAKVKKQGFALRGFRWIWNNPFVMAFISAVFAGVLYWAEEKYYQSVGGFKFVFGSDGWVDKTSNLGYVILNSEVYPEVYQALTLMAKAQAYLWFFVGALMVRVLWNAWPRNNMQYKLIYLLMFPFLVFAVYVPVSMVAKPAFVKAYNYSADLEVMYGPVDYPLNVMANHESNMHGDYLSKKLPVMERQLGNAKALAKWAKLRHPDLSGEALVSAYSDFELN